MASIQVGQIDNHNNLEGSRENSRPATNASRELNGNHSNNNTSNDDDDKELGSELQEADCNNNNQMANISPMRQLKKMGWYWGSISPEFASKLLENEEDGSFLVRDSSSECYIFSMTFKLEGQIHHSRIDYSKGCFSFGQNPPIFNRTAIVEFIEQAIKHSHRGDYLFFLHRDPAMDGPLRFRLIPLSRLKAISSLKHLCRFAILPYVRRDKIGELPIPESLKEYLYEPFSQC